MRSNLAGRLAPQRTGATSATAARAETAHRRTALSAMHGPRPHRSALPAVLAAQAPPVAPRLHTRALPPVSPLGQPGSQQAGDGLPTGDPPPLASRLWLPPATVVRAVAGSAAGGSTGGVALPPMWRTGGSSSSNSSVLADTHRQRSSDHSGGRRFAPFASPRVFMGACASRGAKATMEDAHYLATLDPGSGVLRASGPAAPAGGGGVTSLGVFDGHQGALTATYAARTMPDLLHAALAGRLRPAETQSAHAAALAPGASADPAADALASSFLGFDRWWRDARCDPELTETGWDDSGTTALVALVDGGRLTVGNAGDGAALLARGGGAMRLSEEHRADANAAEVERVLMAGGRVVVTAPGAPPRVVGSAGPARFKASMVTRALGDYSFKYPDALLSPEPAISGVSLTPGDALLLVATDGVTDVLGDDDALGIALDALTRAKEMSDDGATLARAAAAAVTEAALLAGSRDNVTAAVLCFDWRGAMSG